MEVAGARAPNGNTKYRILVLFHGAFFSGVGK